jgi:hypothetical protein
MGLKRAGKRTKIPDDTVMKYLGLFAILAAGCFAQEARKPVCNARNRGQFWPAEANVSQDAARQLFQSGELEMCSLATWRYRWDRLSVNVHHLAPAKHPPKRRH